MSRFPGRLTQNLTLKNPLPLGRHAGQPPQKSLISPSALKLTLTPILKLPLTLLIVFTLSACTGLRPKQTYHLHYFPVNRGCLKVLKLYPNGSYQLVDYRFRAYRFRKTSDKIRGSWTETDSLVYLDRGDPLVKTKSGLELPGRRRYVEYRQCHWWPR